MKRLWTWLKQLLLYAGLDKEAYDKIQKISLSPNWMILNIFSVVVFVASTGFIIVSFFIPSVVSDRIAFSCAAVIMVAIAGLNITKGKDNAILLSHLCVAFVATTYMLGIYNGTLGDPNHPAITFIVLIVALPMVLNGRPAIMMGEMLVACAVFLVIAIHVKSPEVISVDVADVVVFAFISFVLNLHMDAVKAQGYLAQYQANEASKWAESANLAKTEFLFNMSHDIRTPMNAVIGFTELLDKHLDDKELAKSYIRKIKTSNDFLLSLINNVLEMAKIESGEATLDEAYWDAHAFNDTLFSMFDSQMKEKGIEFTRENKVIHPDVLCDETKLREIFLNILSNALKYTPPGGKVTMNLTEIPTDRPGYAMYQTVIEDTGIGMSEEFLPHLFEEFTRERSSTESKLNGTGLGMPIVKKLVDLMEGTIEVESKVGRGTKITVTIPHRIAQQADTNSSTEKARTYDKSCFMGKRILLAEDNELNAEIAITILEDAGFIVEHAEDGIICVNMMEKAEAGFYDLILMDIQMPNLDGYKATQTIRKLSDPKKAGITIVAMTANAFDEDKENAFKAGMNWHIAKPINADELMSALAELLDRQMEPRENL